MRNREDKQESLKNRQGASLFPLSVSSFLTLTPPLYPFIFSFSPFHLIASFPYPSSLYPGNLWPNSVVLTEMVLVPEWGICKGLQRITIFPVSPSLCYFFFSPSSWHPVCPQLSLLPFLLPTHKPIYLWSVFHLQLYFLFMYIYALPFTILEIQSISHHSPLLCFSLTSTLSR